MSESIGAVGSTRTSSVQSSRESTIADMNMNMNISNTIFIYDVNLKRFKILKTSREILSVWEKNTIF